MKKLICMLLALCFVFALAACGATEEKTENDTTTTTAATEAKTTEEETTAAAESNTKPAPDEDDVVVEDTTVLYTIKVVDEAGNAVSAATIAQICDEACVPVKLTEGVGEKKLEANENYHVNLTVMPEGYEYASGAEEYYFDAENVCVITLKAVA